MSEITQMKCNCNMRGSRLCYNDVVEITRETNYQVVFKNDSNEKCV